MFTQCEPIHCRSIAPMQDTPSIKHTYSANIKVQKPYVVKMSAVEQTPTDNGDGTITYHFELDIKIPSYLLAMAVGKLEYKAIGPRTGVIAEPGKDVLDKYAEELSELEDILGLLEDWITPYIWGNYTVLVLPASFPYGGMENPLLTFASPTIIVGDKSQVHVATHEIAHSWSGNEVTCRDWSNLWLNEGFTVFEERKVTAIQKNSTEFALIAAQLGNVDLWIDINAFGEESSYSSLHPVLNGYSPDDSFSEVPYEKGFQFLVYLESLMASEEDFQDFVRTYMRKYSQQSITYVEFRETFEEYVTTKYDEATSEKILNAIDWDGWIKKGGANPPEWKETFATEAAKEFEHLADAYIDLKGEGRPENYEIYLETDNPNLKVIFLNRLVARQDELTLKTMIQIDEDYNCTWEKNPEIGQRWFPLSIALQYEPAYAQDNSGCHQFISWQGRMKYINPVYQALVRYGRRDLAYRWFKEHQKFYHPIAVTGLKKVIFASISREE